MGRIVILKDTERIDYTDPFILDLMEKNELTFVKEYFHNENILIGLDLENILKK